MTAPSHRSITPGHRFITPALFTAKGVNPAISFRARLGWSVRGAQVLSVQGRKTAVRR